MPSNFTLTIFSKVYPSSEHTRASFYDQQTNRDHHGNPKGILNKYGGSD